MTILMEFDWPICLDEGSSRGALFVTILEAQVPTAATMTRLAMIGRDVCLDQTSQTHR